MLKKLVIFILLIMVVNASENIENFKSESYCQIKNNKLFINKQNDSNYYGYNICYSKENIVKDLRVSIEFKSISGNIDQGGGIAWRIIDNRNYYVARFNPLENNFRLYYVKNGRRIELESSTVELKDGYNKMIILHMKNTIYAYINGKLLLSYKDSTFDTGGYVGVWSKADASTLFKNIIVTKL